MKCEYCKKEHDGSYGSGRFCSVSCSRARSLTEETKEKISGSLRKYIRANGPTGHNERVRRQIGRTINSGRVVPENLFEVANQTRRKILLRLNLGCFNCGWDKTKCDLHHIKSLSSGGGHHHSNLTYVCPNCHRLLHEKKLYKVATFSNKVGDTWKKWLYF